MSLVLLLGISPSSYSQNLSHPSINEEDVVQSTRIMFYNLENLFFPGKDSTIADKDFTPSGNYHWTYTRYKRKLNSISKVIIAIGGWRPPALIGICEIEGQKVIQDLIYTTALKRSNLNYIHVNSPDKRGIDVALLYDKNVFVPVYFEPLSIVDELKPEFVTRDILYVKGILYNSDTFHVFVNHWPSRRGGKIESESKRLLVASILKVKVDSLHNVIDSPNILIMGDFNDEPDDKSLFNILGAKKKDDTTAHLINLMIPFQEKGEGSYAHIQNFEVWGIIDQIIISKSLLERFSSGENNDINARIFKPSWLLNLDDGRPYRTYRGMKYFGGYSDHLPVFFDIQAIKMD